MKYFIISSGILILVFAIFQGYHAFAFSSTIRQAYKVIKVEKEFEIRYYPSVTIATISSSAKSYKDFGNYGFRKLANYIFGGNKTNQKIEMTAPVHMDINDCLSTMSFVMPPIYSINNLPIPNDSTVNLSNTSSEYVAAITFNGFASDRDITIYTLKLENALNEKKNGYYGNFRYLGYNPPYQLIGRRNEVIVSVNWDTK
jgi:hypothetical protein